MECLIPGSNMKVINKVMQALSKISDELYIDCRKDCLSLVAMNQNTTAFAKYNFDNTFFVTYEIESDSQASGESLVTCKVYMKSLLNVFKQRMDRKMELCHIVLKKNDTKILFKLKYKHDVLVVHRLNLIDFDYLSFDYDPDDRINTLCGSGQVFNQILSNFQATDSTLSLEVNENKTHFRNYNVGIESAFKGIHSQVALLKSEFMQYSIGEATNIVLSLKPFRSIISFAEHFNLNITLNFKTGGSPIIMLVKSTTFEVDYILSTVSPDGSTQTTSSDINTPIFKIPEKDKNNITAQPVNLTVQDQEAIESMNWEDDDFEKNEEAETHERGSFTNVLNGLRKEIQTKEKEDEVLDSPEVKRARIFGRCFDPTFHASMLDFGETLAENSDEESIK